MIIDYHPSIPKRKADGLKFIGYWREGPISPNKLKLPVPGAAAMAAFLRTITELCLLPSPQHYIDENWDTAEKLKVVEYLKAGKFWEGWRGWSECRFGDNDDNGCTDLTDGTYVWPEGFAHYVEVHDVKPPQEFIDHVLKNSQK